MKKIISIIIVLCFFSCSKYSPEIREALNMAGDNKKELVKVLEHYKGEGKEEKLKAAEFLIANLPYNYSYDTTNLYKYRIVANTADYLIKKKLFDSVQPTINSLWNRLKKKEDPYNNIYAKPIKQDIMVISSKFLIANIEIAYTQWKNNPYAKDSVSFNDFCEYVLPYRQIQGKAIENWRGYFLKNNKKHFSDLYPMSFIAASDSIVKQYIYGSDYFRYEPDQGIPLLKFEDYIKIRNGDCVAKSWINTYIINAEGIPTVSDFIPAWGHREFAHQWNAILYGGKMFYFDSFSNPIHNTDYNNLFEGDLDGKMRLPKVYRNTFSTHIEGPVSDKRVAFVNIPPLFLNVKKKDVSEAYFNAVDVSVNLTKNTPENTYYAYLCVLGIDMQWVPVQWGKINGNKVNFKKMGTDIVYQIGFYENGIINPCGVPFLLDRNGDKKLFKLSNEKYDVLAKRKYPLKKTLLNDAVLLKGSLIQASNSPDFSMFKLIGKIDFEPEVRPHDFYIKRNKKHQYFRVISKNKIKIKELDLLCINNKNEETSITGKPLQSLVLENNSTTWNGIDLGVPKQVDVIRITPKNDGNHIVKNFVYELFYVDEGRFISFGTQKANSYELKFKNVPKNVLLYLKCLNEGKQSRIFKYINGEQIWH